LEGDIKNNITYDTIPIKKIKKKILQSQFNFEDDENVFFNKIDLCDNDCLLNSFDMEYNTPIIGFDVSRRRFFNVQTIEYNQNENSIINIIKPCNFFINLDSNDNLLVNNEIDWFSKRKWEYTNKKGEKKKKSMTPGYLFAMISLKKINDKKSFLELVCGNFYFLLISSGVKW
jgi:hypothetical protein